MTFEKSLGSLVAGRSEWFTKTVLDGVANSAHRLYTSSRMKSADMIADLEELRARIQGGDENARARLGKLASVLDLRANQEDEFKELKTAAVKLWEKHTDSTWKPYSPEVAVSKAGADDDLAKAVLARYGK